MVLSELYAGKQRLRPAEPQFTRSADVIVCGLGTAGSLAALFSGENGLSVLGIEPLTCLGGTHRAGGVAHHYFGCPGGRYEALEETVSALAQRCGSTLAEAGKMVLEQALAQKGVDIFYESCVCGVYLEEKTVVGLRVLTPEGVEDWHAKVVLDCTADATVAVMAGCQVECGRASDGQTQPYSIVSLVRRGDKYRYTNVDFGRADPYDPEDLSRAILFSRAYDIAEGHAGTELIAQMPMLGFREGRRIVPEETVTVGDLFADKKTDTPMFYSYADLDKHGWDIAFDGEELGDWAIGANLGAVNVTVAVPYRAILPKDHDGILVPCRALGVDRDISSCVRMLPDMKKLAEVAAEWVTLSIAQGIPLGQVSYARLREKLEASGCLSENHDRGYRLDGRRDWDGSPFTPRDIHWLTRPEELEAQLKTQTPGIAIWSARRMGEAAIPTLQSLLTSRDENTRKHAAFALAILGNGDGIPALRAMVMERDGLMLKDCRKNNNLRGCMAIYFLGRLADAGIAQELIELIWDPAETQKPVYRSREVKTTRYEIGDFEGVYFQFLSQAVMALIRIADAHPDLRAPVAKAFREAFQGDAYYRRITARPIQSSEGNMATTIKTVAQTALTQWDLAQ